MAIPSLAEAKAKVGAAEIASYEADITKHLEQSVTITYLEDTTITNREIIRTYAGKTLTEQGIEALTDSIEAAGWDEVLVENGVEPPRQGIGSSGAPSRPMVTVSFKPAAAGGTPPVTPETP